MPLRPPLVAFHPQGPAPAVRRRVHCPHCRHAFNISRRAVTMRCPSCTQPLAFDDLELNQRVDGQVTTMGHVALGPASEMHGQLVCGSVQQAGRFNGTITAYGGVDLQRGSQTDGRIVARALSIQAGSQVEATVRIGPSPAPPRTPKRRTLEAIDRPARGATPGLRVVRPLH